MKNKKEKFEKYPIIKCKNVKKIYKLGEFDVPALKGVSLEVYKGDFVVIIGPSGSGKSTLMHLMGALDHPTEGSVFIDRENISSLDDFSLAMLRRHKMGFVFQSFNLIPTLSAFENVLIPTAPISSGKDELEERGIKLLELVDLGDRMFHKPDQLSGGQRQRVSIARALINDPEIIYADEPTGNLDSETGDKVIDLMRNLNENENKTFVIVTHDQELLQYATKKFYLKDGLLSEIKEQKRKSRRKKIDFNRL